MASKYLRLGNEDQNTDGNFDKVIELGEAGIGRSLSTSSSEGHTTTPTKRGKKPSFLSSSGDSDEEDEFLVMSKFNPQSPKTLEMISMEIPTRVFTFDGIDNAKIENISSISQQPTTTSSPLGYHSPPPPSHFSTLLNNPSPKSPKFFAALLLSFVGGALSSAFVVIFLFQPLKPVQMPSSVPDASFSYYENAVINDANFLLSKVKPSIDNTVEEDEYGSPNHLDGNGVMYFNSKTSLSLLRISPSINKQSSPPSDQYNTYTSLLRGFDAQKNQAYCGLSTVATVINSLIHATSSSNSLDSGERPLLRLDIDPIYSPYPYATQHDILSDCTSSAAVPMSDSYDSVLTPPYGTTLAQISGVLKCHLKQQDGWFVNHHNIDPMIFTVDEFRDLLLDALSSSPYTRVLANIHRPPLSQPGGGHWSPISTYDRGTDSFLVLDVAKYKFPPFFVKTATLYDSLSTVDECGVWKWEEGKQDLLWDKEDLEWEEQKTILGCQDSFRGVVIAMPTSIPN